MTTGYAGRRFWIVRENTVIAAVRSKSAQFQRGPIDRSDEEYDGWRHIDPVPDNQSLQCNVSGLAHPDNYVLLEEDWLGDTFTDVRLVFPDGTVVEAADGAFLSSLDYQGEVRGAAQFSAVFLFSGLVSAVQPLVLTSRPYGLESTDTMTVEGRALRGYYSPVVFESMDVGAVALDGTMIDQLVTYDAWPIESMDVGAEALDGTLVDLAISYDDWPVEEMDVAAVPLDGTLNEILIRYEQWPTEEMEVSAEALDGTLVDPNATYKSVVLADSPVAYYRLGENSGTTAADETGNHDGTYVGTVTLGADALITDEDTAVGFNGSDSYISTDWSGILSGPFTIEFWVKTIDTDPDTHGIVSWGDSTSDGSKAHCRINSDNTNGVVGAARFEVGGGYYIGSIMIADDLPHHVVVVSDGADVDNTAVYIDGEIDSASGVNPQAMSINAGADVAIGRRTQISDNEYFSGVLDEIAIYSYALSAERVAAHYNQGVAS